MLTTLLAALRLSALIGLLFAGLATVLLLFPMFSQRRRDWAVQHWSGLVVRSCGVRIQIDPHAATAVDSAAIDAASRGRMIVANHISWLDIFVINAVVPSCFIAKSDIAAWPLIGTLVGRVGTLFLERGKRHAVHDMIQIAQAALRDGRRIAVFPEGTTGDGLSLLPFHANLIEAAVQASAGIVPLGLRYQNAAGVVQSGEGGPLSFVGTTSFVASVLRIVKGRGVIALVLPLAELFPSSEQRGAIKPRHALANAARSQLKEALGLPLEDTIPETVRDLRAAPR